MLMVAGMQLSLTSHESNLPAFSCYFCFILKISVIESVGY